jgi:predicted extracellular nuclease
MTITTRGVVTGVRTNGFFIQEPDASIDADTNTSEGIFVFTSSAPPAAAAVGNLVQVGGTVIEFIPAADPFSPPLTEISGSPTVTLISTGNPLPTPVTLTSGDTGAGGVNAGSIENLERYEGMRVRVNSLTVVAPTQGTVTETSATSTSNGVFFGVITGVARPFREPGIQANDPVPSGSGVTIPPVPRFDFNPERLRVDSDALVGGAAINVATGATVTNLVGPLDYAFRTYTILPDPASPPTVSGGMATTPASAPLGNELTIASYNLERFFDDVNDPGVGEPVLTTTAYNNRLNKASIAVRNFLRFPDILGVVEVENLSTLQTLATKINNDATANSQPNPNYAAFLVEGNDVGGIDVGFLVKTSVVSGATPRVTVNAVVQEGKTTLFTNPDSSTELLNDRPSLRLDATVNFPNGTTFPVTVIVNHLRSLNDIDSEAPGSNGWPTDGARVRAKRRAQAEFLANLVQARQTANANERIALIGDFNAFEFNDGFVDLMGTIQGAPTPANQVVLASADLVNPDLTNLFNTAPATERYSFTFDGSAQSLDHALVNQALIASTLARRIEHPRIGADFPETARNDANSAARLSDHDPVVGYFQLQPCSISCPTNITTTAAAGQCGATVTYNPPTTSGDCGVPVTCTPPSGSFFNVGATTVTCSTPSETSCSFTVTVNDTQAPTIACPSNITVNENPVGSGGAQVNFTTPTPSDNCSGATTVCSPASGSVFPVGTTTVNCTATDASGNTAQCSFAVTVQSCGAITCPTDVIVGTTGNSATVNYSAPTPTGNCGTITCSPPSGSSFPLGVTTVSCASSIASRTCSFAVKVNKVTHSLNDPLGCTGPGNTVAGAFTLTNNSASQTTATATVELPDGLLALKNTCATNVGTCLVVNASTISFTAALAAGQTANVSYQAQIGDQVTTGTQLCANLKASFGGGPETEAPACVTTNCPALGPGLLPSTTSPVNDQRAGSVLIYNIYTSSIDPNRQNTRINLTNTNPSLPAFAHMFFIDGATCSVADSFICLTPNQTATFLVSDLDPGTTGYIVVVAVDRQGCPTNFNYLIGDEYVKFTGGHAANLGAEAITAIAGGRPFCNENSVTATLPFDGVSYSALPHAVALDNIGSRVDGNETILILNRIGGNLATATATLTSIFGLLYDDAENVVSFSFAPGTCQFRNVLTSNLPRTAPRFDTVIPAGRTGWMKLWVADGTSAMTGAMINFNASAGSNPNAFNQGHNLHVLTLTTAASFTMPIFPPAC